MCGPPLCVDAIHTNTSENLRSHNIASCVTVLTTVHSKATLFDPSAMLLREGCEKEQFNKHTCSGMHKSRGNTLIVYELKPLAMRFSTPKYRCDSCILVVAQSLSNTF